MALKTSNRPINYSYFLSYLVNIDIAIIDTNMTHDVYLSSIDDISCLADKQYLITPQAINTSTYLSYFCYVMVEYVVCICGQVTEMISYCDILRKPIL